jgi:nucleoside-diphosphate-sugar epimerase
MAKHLHSVSRPTVLLTGASGVVGRALLERLTGTDIIALVHRTPVVGEHVTSIKGDVAAPRLGLSDTEYAALAAKVDAVIHCAAITDFNRTDGTLETTNIEGTGHMVEFAKAADVVLYHVSTAFVHTKVDGDRGKTAAGYAASKSAGEDLVRASGVKHVILRPSVVIGDSVTGEIAAFQGLHQVVAGVFGGIVPMIPFDETWPIDFIPADVVADGIAVVVENGITEGEFWLSAGDKALTLRQGMDLTVELASEMGRTVDAPRFVPPEMFERLIGPVFIDALPEKIKRNVLRMLEFFATYLQDGAYKPSSLDELVELGMAPLPDQYESLAASVRYWAQVKGILVETEEKVA